MPVVAGFDFPEGLHYQAEDQVWARLEADGSVTVGITALGIHQAGGEVYMCRAKDAGQLIERGRALAVIEVAKAVLAVRSPLNGTVLAVNEALATSPELVHEAPYGAGWLSRLAPLDWAADAATLLAGDAVLPAMQHQAWLHNLEVQPIEGGST